MNSRILGLGAVALVAAPPLSAEVVATSDSSFVTREEAIVEADTKATWLALISPAKWWNSAHTWSGDAANLTIRPQAGGCFCERIPEDPDSDEVTLEGSVEHMRVIQAYPERALRMQGGLGPLQSEPVIGVLTVAISEVEDGTRIVWEYNVGGAMRYEIPVISQAVDGVMSLQLAGLAGELGLVKGPAVTANEEASEEDAAAGGDDPGGVDGSALPGSAVSDDEGAAEPAEDQDPSVEEAFSDLNDQ